MKENQANLAGIWTGGTFGTHRAEVFAECGINQGQYYFEFRVRVLSAGLDVQIFAGVLPSPNINPGEDLQLVLSEIIDGNPTEFQIQMSLRLTLESELKGLWTASNGAKGTIILNWVKENQAENIPIQEPAQIYAREYVFGSLRLYRNDIEKIIEIVSQLIGPDGKIFITEEEKNEKQISFAADYLRKAKKQSELRGLTISGQQTIKGLTNSLVLNLRREHFSTLSVQSTERLWVYSTPMAIKELLEEKSSKIIEFYRKHGLGINFAVFMGLLVFLPDRIESRALLVGGFILFGLLHFNIHKRVSHSILNPKDFGPVKFKEKHPSISYIFLTILSAAITVLVTWAATFLPARDWLQNIITYLWGSA